MIILTKLTKIQENKTLNDTLLIAGETNTDTPWLSHKLVTCCNRTKGIFAIHCTHQRNQQYCPRIKENTDKQLYKIRKPMQEANEILKRERTFLKNN